MSKYGDKADSTEGLVKAFQDAQLRTGHYGNIPYIPDETAQSHLFRIIDYMNSETWDDTSVNAISKEVILTLLQCAARLYEGGGHAKEAVDLIESEDTRAILSIGIQNSLSQVIHQRCVESIRSIQSEATDAKSCSQQAGLSSAIRKNKARQLNQQAMLIEHISSLCHWHSVALQNTFDGPTIDEQFMFTNYTTLLESLNLCEKSWLATLLPHIFQWETIEEANQAACTNAKAAISSQDAVNPYAVQGTNPDADASRDSPASLGSAGHLHLSCPLGPEVCNNTSDDKLVSSPSYDSAIISNESQHHISFGTYKDIQEAFNFMDTSKPPLLINDGDVRHWLEKSTPEEINRMWSICCNWRNQH